jgi:hypothetical protein
MTQFTATETDWPTHHAVITGATGDIAVVAADATHIIRVLMYYLVVDIAGTARWEEGAGGTALSGVLTLPANGGLVIEASGLGIFETTTVNTALSLELVTSTVVGGNIKYQLVEPTIT